jgi:pilus assembly protein Flp/PilA
MPEWSDDAGSPKLCRECFAVALRRDRQGNARTTIERDFFIYYRSNVMKSLVMSARNFLREEDGVTAIEYGLLAALIAVAITVGANLLGTNLNLLFSAIGTCLTTNALAAACAI